MSAKTITENLEKEDLIDDLSEKESVVPAQEDDVMDLKKLEELKLKSRAKQEQKMYNKIKKERSIAFGVIGSGQSGGNLAQCYYKLGYDAVAINTAMQDLNSLSIIPDSNKLLLDFTLGGAAKDIELGKQAAEANRNSIKELIETKLLNSQLNIFCLSLGGGSGAGSCETIVDVLSEIGKPIVVMAVLPTESEDSQTKKNALETLSKLSKMVKEKKVANILCVDNAKIEAIYHDVSPLNFFDVANQAIVNPVDVFNTLSTMKSPTKPLDSMEWAKLFTDGEGFSVFGELTIENVSDVTALAEAVMNSLDSNLLASSFDLKNTKYVGVMLAANENVWKTMKRSSFDYALGIINDRCDNPVMFHGSYVVNDIKEDVIKVYTMFSGVGLPMDRVEQLKKDVKNFTESSKSKGNTRDVNLTIDTGSNEATSQIQKIKDQISQKSSAFGKFTKNVIDRRK